MPVKKRAVKRKPIKRVKRKPVKRPIKRKVVKRKSIARSTRPADFALFHRQVPRTSMLKGTFLNNLRKQVPRTSLLSALTDADYWAGVKKKIKKLK